MEFLRYAPHLNIDKIKVNGFLFGLNVSIGEKVRILMPQNLHDVLSKYSWNTLFIKIINTPGAFVSPNGKIVKS
jgi:hypothetical protein